MALFTVLLKVHYFLPRILIGGVAHARNLHVLRDTANDIVKEYEETHLLCCEPREEDNHVNLAGCVTIFLLHMTFQRRKMTFLCRARIFFVKN